MTEHKPHDHPETEGAPHDWNEMYSGQVGDYEAPNPLFLELIEGLPPGKALDVGCGAGGLLVELAKRGWQVTGIDVASKAIAAAKKVIAKHGVQAELHVADAARWKPTGPYDLITSSFAGPDKAPGRAAMFRMMQSALAPGGTLVFEDFDASMCKHEFLAPFDLVTIEELRAGIPELEILRAEIIETPVHQHGEAAAPAGEPWTAALLHAKKPL